VAVADTAACTAGMRSPSLATLCCLTTFFSACIRQTSQGWSGRSGAERMPGGGAGSAEGVDRTLCAARACFRLKIFWRCVSS